MNAHVVWFPPKDKLYASVTQDRDLCQGDVFDGIPFARFPPPSGPELTPKVRRGMGLVLGHPCDLSAAEKGATTPWRTMCRVFEDRDGLITLDGRGHFYAFPLPGLKGEDGVWYADFRYTSVVDEHWLALGGRIASLTIDGLLALQRRIAHFYSRGLLHLPSLAANAHQHPDHPNYEVDRPGDEIYSSAFVRVNG